MRLLAFQNPGGYHMLTRNADCPGCGRRHSFCLRADRPTALRYVYVCPATGRRSFLGAWGVWEPADHPGPGAVGLDPAPGDPVGTHRRRAVPPVL